MSTIFYKATRPDGTDSYTGTLQYGRYVAGIIERTRQLTCEEATNLLAAWDATRGAAWDAAGDATRGAAFALLVQDLITPEQFERLYGPWRSVIGDVRQDQS